MWSKLRATEICVLCRYVFVGRALVRFWTPGLCGSGSLLSLLACDLRLAAGDRASRPQCGCARAVLHACRCVRHMVGPLADMVQHVDIGTALTPAIASDQSCMFKFAQVGAHHRLTGAEFGGEGSVAGEAVAVLPGVMEQEGIEQPGIARKCGCQQDRVGQRGEAGTCWQLAIGWCRGSQSAIRSPVVVAPGIG